MEFDKAMNNFDNDQIMKNERETERPCEEEKLWEPDKTEISVADLDEAVANYVAKRGKYEDAKAVSDDLHAEQEKSKGQLIKLLTLAGKEKYHVAGIGSVGLSQALKVKVPEGSENKKLMFDFIRASGGEEMIDAYATIHYARLNSLYNELKEKNGPDWHMPGLELPQVENKLSLRRD